jgi:hypothetical protein
VGGQQTTRRDLFVGYIQSIIPTTPKDAPLKSWEKRAHDKDESELLVQEWWQTSNKSEAAGDIPAEPERFTFENHEYRNRLKK